MEKNDLQSNGNEDLEKKTNHGILNGILISSALGLADGVLRTLDIESISLLNAAKLFFPGCYGVGYGSTIQDRENDFGLGVIYGSCSTVLNVVAALAGELVGYGVGAFTK